MEKEKIRFGIRLIINDLWKIIIIYILAYALNCFIPTLVTHVAFIILRQVCFGFHFQNSLLCLAASATSLPICLYIIEHINMDVNQLIFLLGIFATIILLCIAPIGTKKRPIFNQKHRKYLRKQLFIRLLVLWFIILILKGYQSFILYAIILISISVIIQKILGVRTYEN